MTGEWCLRGGMLKYGERGQEGPGLHLVSRIKESKVHLKGKNKTKNKRSNKKLLQQYYPVEYG